MTNIPTQKWYKVFVTYRGITQERGLWANSLDEARDKAYFKWIDADEREIKEDNENE